ncbi:MAG: T9SS type A sorting domain-containing protein, partial [Cytophagales bacterium]|nr:T9SS type A sorting domain-containing protein [Cytophagales bacterium]
SVNIDEDNIAWFTNGNAIYKINLPAYHSEKPLIPLPSEEDTEEPTTNNEPQTPTNTDKKPTPKTDEDRPFAINSSPPKSSLRIYPNPASEYFTLLYALKKEEKISFQIRSLSNQLFVVIPPLDHPEGIHQTLFGHNLPTGVYIYSLKIGEDTYTGKIIKN